MQYTVKDVLSIPFLNSARLLSAEQFVRSKTIESVTVIEMPVENFVRENELVLTTAIGCGNNPSLFLSFVNDIYSSGASALAIATGRHVKYIPQEIIDFAKEHQFPLIELPWEIRFSDIIKKILEEIHQWEQDSLIKIDFIQRQLLQLYLDNRPLQEAFDYLAKEFQTKIHLIRQGETPTASPSWLNEIEHIHKLPLKINEQTIIYTNSHSFVQILPIQILNHDIGHLLLTPESSSTLPIPWSILNQAVTTLNLWLQKEQSIIINKNKELEEFIQLLLKGDWVSPEKIIEQGQKLGVNIESPYICIVGIPENLNEFLLNKEYDLSNNTANVQFSRKLKEIAESCSNSLNRKVFCMYNRDLYIIFLECSIEDASNSAHSFLDLIDKYIEKEEIPLFSWGIGENHAGILTFSQSYKNARTALEIGRSHKGLGQRSTYANTGMFQLLSSISNDASAKELVHSTIGSVAKYDKERGLDLLLTLTSYIYHQGNVSQTSRALSLHRQSLIYRLRKIETLTNRSLNDPDDLFLLQLCLKLWSVRFESNTNINKDFSSSQLSVTFQS